MESAIASPGLQQTLTLGTRLHIGQLDINLDNREDTGFEKFDDPFAWVHGAECGGHVERGL